jgi:3-hydroxyisobutyrate dehydrogenase
MAILRQSALYAPTFDKKLNRMLEQNYANPNFPTKHLLKDMRLFGQAASEYHLPIALIEAVEHLLQQTIAAGFAEADYAALFSQIDARPTESNI